MGGGRRHSIRVLGRVIRPPFTRVQVSGTSMLPTLHAGDRLLVRRTRRVRPGDLVVVPDPREPTRVLVKRVRAIRVHGIEVAGDNPGASTDSRTFGVVPRRSLVGRAVYRYAPARRSGRL
jgi:nickel-type superoxide dismutase maturation protease